MSADEVRFIREVFKLSQRDLAKALGVSYVTAARWETTGANHHAPTGLQEQVLRALHNVASRVHDDPAQRDEIKTLLLLGIGALIFYLLVRK